MIYIVAKSWREYFEYCRDNDIPMWPHGSRCVRNVESVSALVLQPRDETLLLPGGDQKVFDYLQTRRR